MTKPSFARQHAWLRWHKTYKLQVFYNQWQKIPHCCLLLVALICNQDRCHQCFSIFITDVDNPCETTSGAVFVSFLLKSRLELGQGKATRMIKWRTWCTRTGWKNLICWAFTEQKVSEASYCWSRVTRWEGYREGRTRLLRCQCDATRSNKRNSHWIQQNHRVMWESPYRAHLVQFPCSIRVT